MDYIRRAPTSSFWWQNYFLDNCSLANFCHACESRHPESIDFIRQNRIRLPPLARLAFPPEADPPQADSLWLRAAGGNDFYWIPASAGMTKCGFKNILGRLKGYFPGNNSFNFAVKAGKTSL